MKTKDFYFDLHAGQIAQYPPEQRGTSKLLVLEPEGCRITHDTMQNFPHYIKEHSTIVFNDTKVRKARLTAESEYGGKIEVLFLNQVDSNTWRILTNKMKKRRQGTTLTFPEGVRATIVLEEEGSRLLQFSSPIEESYFDHHGTIPLPPYIQRDPIDTDNSRYQTIYAKQIGSVAAPTAGLHFTDEIIGQLHEKRIHICYLTLTVGFGTFAPIRSEHIEDHDMHEESYVISPQTASAITDAKRKKRPIIAVGTTCVRALESAWDGEILIEGPGTTNLYIQPGYNFSVVDQLFTNFHTPQSSLLVLVSAFAGKQCIDHAYSEAMNNDYRFFSYGDAMFITSIRRGTG